MTQPSAPAPKLLASLRQLAATALGMVQTRLALAGVEVEEELQRLLALLLSAVGLLIFGSLALISVTALLVLASSAENRLLVLALCSGVYVLLASYFWTRISRQLHDRPPFLEATLTELSKDHAALKGGADDKVAAP